MGLRISPTYTRRPRPSFKGPIRNGGCFRHWTHESLTLIILLFLFKLNIHTLSLCFFLASDRTLRLGVHSHASAYSRRYLTIFCLLCFDLKAMMLKTTYFMSERKIVPS
ncbi:hypothetical protein V8G54_018639 [Vigna mungo]|uniref:Uncharacterized protein n=1 Tax=Vigna mungo TaxID=3915 RepID=A0AAQ3NB51_VIGMU